MSPVSATQAAHDNMPEQILARGLDYFRDHGHALRHGQSLAYHEVQDRHMPTARLIISYVPSSTSLYTSSSASLTGRKHLTDPIDKSDSTCVNLPMSRQNTCGSEAKRSSAGLSSPGCFKPSPRSCCRALNGSFREGGSQF